MIASRYCAQQFQDLTPASYRLWAYSVQTYADHNFSEYVLFSDKSTFTNKRISNICNYYESVASNIYVTLSELYKRRCTVNVLAGIIYTHLIGSYLVPSHLDEYSYLVLLWKMLSPLNPDLVNIRQNQIPVQNNKNPLECRSL